MSANVGSLIVDLIARTSQFSGPMRGAVSSVNALSGSIDSIGGRISGLVGNIARIGGAIGGVASVAWGVKLAADAEQAEVGFTTLLGSAQRARQMMEDLEEFASRTPFQFPELAASAKKMLALGFAADEVMPTLQTLGDATSGLGGNAELLDRITVALGQMQAKGVVSAEEMRQLAEAGIPAWKMLADAIGVDIPTAMELVKDRAVQSSQAVPALLQGIADKFGGGMEAQSKTLGGIFSTLKDNVAFLFRDMGQSITEALDLKDKGQGVINYLAGIRQTVADLSGTAVRFMVDWGSSAVKLVGFLTGVRIALTAVQGAQRMIATTQIFINALSGPKGWAAIAAGIAVATAAALTFDAALSSIATRGEKAAASAKALGGAPGLRKLKADADAAAQALSGLAKKSNVQASLAGMQAAAVDTGKAFQRLRSAQEGFTNRSAQLNEMQSGLSPRMQQSGTAKAIRSALRGSNVGIDQLTALKAKYDELSAAPGRMGENARRASASLQEEITKQTALLEDEKSVWEQLERGELDVGQATAVMGDLVEQSTASLDSQRAALSGIVDGMPSAIAALGGLEAAMRAAEKAVESARTPVENLLREQGEIDSLFAAGLIDAAQKQQLLKKATEDFDRALGGPAEKIKDLQRQIETFGQSAHEAMIAQFRGVAGVTREQLTEMEKLAEKLKNLDLQKRMFEEGKQIADSLRNPIEQMHDEADHLQRLLDAGAISENQFAQAMVKQQEDLFGKFGEAGHPGGLEKGTREAVMQIQKSQLERSGNDERKQAIKLQKDQLQEQRKANQNLEKINDNIHPMEVGNFA